MIKKNTRSKIFGISLMAFASFGSTLVVGSNARAEDTISREVPDPLDVGLTNVFANGNGCPGGLQPGQVTLSDDAGALLVDFGLMGAVSGTNQPITDSRRVCSVAIQINAPAGWTYRISEAGFLYGARVPTGAAGNIKIETWIQGAGNGSDSDQLTIEGPVAKSDGAQLTFPNSPFVPCTEVRQLNFRNALWVPFGDTFSRVRFQSPVAYHIEWKKCDSGS